MNRLLWLMLLLSGCATGKPPASALYRTVAGPDNLRFRIAKPGAAMNDIRAAEALRPLYDDAFGLVYADSTQEGHRVTIEYYQLNRRNDPRLRTLVVNVRCADDTALQTLVEELSAYFSLQYVQTTQATRWRGDDLELELRLWPDRTGLTLNLSKAVPAH